MRKGIVSVIVPIYNAGIYLEKCLNLLSRADDFFEIILIDDGSTDDSLSVCQMYAQNKKNVRVIYTIVKGKVILLTAFLEKNAGDYQKAINLAKNRMKWLRN